MAVQRIEVKSTMFDSQAMVEHSEEQPASEAAMMASIMVGRASSSISSSSGGGPPPKTVSPSQVVNEKNDRWRVPKKLKIYRSTLVLPCWNQYHLDEHIHFSCVEFVYMQCAIDDNSRLSYLTHHIFTFSSFFRKQQTTN